MRIQFICLAFILILLCPYASSQWVQTNGPNGGNVTCFATSGANLFAGTNNGPFLSTGNVFVSTNNGTSWTAVNAGMTNTHVQALAVSGGILFAGTGNPLGGDGGVFLSTDNGTSWTAVNNGLPGYAYDTTVNFPVFCINTSGANLFAGTWGRGVFLSTNNGTSWTAVNAGMTNTHVDDLAVSGGNLFAGTDGGVFLSTDSGTSWAAVNSGLTNKYGNVSSVRALAVSGTNLFAGTDGGVFLSTDSGTSWAAVNSGLTNTNVMTFAVSGGNLFAGTYDGGVFLSTDSGTSWAAVNTGLTNTYVFALAVSGGNLFAGTSGTGVWRRLLSEMTTSFDPVKRELPREFLLQQNYPNPFNPSTSIKYELPKSTGVRLSVFDMLGREVSTLVNERRDAGVHEVKFDGSPLASGVYFYRLQAEDFVQSQQLMILK